MNQLMNHGGVCRTAPATPGLLINCSDDSSALVISKNLPFHKKVDKKSFE
jgi:hypothetical protein